MTPLSQKYFYGTVAAAATACVATGIITFGAQLFSGPFAAYHGVFEGVLTILFAVIFLAVPISIIFGLVGGIVLLAIPLALTRKSSRAFQILAGALVGVVFDLIGILDFKVSSKSDLGNDVPNIDLLTGLTGSWPAKGAADAWERGQNSLALVQFSAPIFAGILAGYVFSLCMKAKARR
jgi:hypothetical protein